jgi:hypothetical protein
MEKYITRHTSGSSSPDSMNSCQCCEMKAHTQNESGGGLDTLDKRVSGLKTENKVCVVYSITCLKT